MGIWKIFTVSKGLYKEKEELAVCTVTKTFSSFSFGLTKEDWKLIAETMNWKIEK